MFGTLQDRLIRELAQRGIDDIEAANRWLREDYLPHDIMADPPRWKTGTRHNIAQERQDELVRNPLHLPSTNSLAHARVPQP